MFLVVISNDFPLWLSPLEFFSKHKENKTKQREARKIKPCWTFLGLNMKDCYVVLLF